MEKCQGRELNLSVLWASEALRILDDTGGNKFRASLEVQATNDFSKFHNCWPLGLFHRIFLLGMGRVRSNTHFVT